ncbi:MAG: glycosyltransferase family 39 protein [Saprospiraceae bacterium]
MARPSRTKKDNFHKSGSTQGKKKKLSPSTSSPSALMKWWPLFLLGISVIVVLQARLRLLAIPMERDEAGFAYIGHWLLKGESLYVDMVDNKLPGLYILYGFFTTIFGYNATGVHIGLLIANAVSAVCFYMLMRDLFNRFIAVTSTAFLLILLADPNVLGFAAHATQLLLPFVMGGFYMFWQGIRTERKSLLLISGLLLGLAFIIKQQSVVFGLVVALLWWPLRILWNKKENGRLPIVEWLMLGIGGLMPVTAVVVYFKMTGRLDELLFWSVKQPSRMTATFTQSRWELFQHFVPLVTRAVVALWISACAGLVLIFMSGFKKGNVWFAFLMAVFGLASVVIGAAFYQHYFILALPGVALLAAIALYWISNKLGNSGATVCCLVGSILVLWPLVRERKYFFSPDYNKIHQQMYSFNMFPELERIGKELARRVPEGSRIGVMGSEPEVLVAADRESCSKHLFMYPILSDPVLSPPMQDEYLHDMESCLPDYIVYNGGILSWTSGYDKLQMFENLMKWINDNYTTLGLAEFRKDMPGELVWDGELSTYQSQNELKVYVFKKK